MEDLVAACDSLNKHYGRIHTDIKLDFSMLHILQLLDYILGCIVCLFFMLKMNKPLPKMSFSKIVGIQSL